MHDVPANNITLTGHNFETPNLLADGPKKVSVLRDEIVKITNQISNGTGGGNKSLSSGFGTGLVEGNVTGNVTTGAFVAFGNSTKNGEKITGNVHDVVDAF